MLSIYKALFGKIAVVSFDYILKFITTKLIMKGFYIENSMGSVRFF